MALPRDLPPDTGLGYLRTGPTTRRIVVGHKCVCRFGMGKAMRGALEARTVHVGIEGYWQRPTERR
jgi:hypothetical protein